MKKLLSFVLVLCLFACSSISASAGNTESNNGPYYMHAFFEKLGKDVDYEDGYPIDYMYWEAYYHYSDTGISSPDEATPDYVLIFSRSTFVIDMVERVCIGPYVVFWSPSEMGTLGYHIYIPSEDKLFTLKEAYEASVPGIDKAFTESDEIGLAVLGDIDNNNVLNIKDATLIQKIEADLFPENLKIPSHEVIDYNLDSKINVRDATDIQKHLAGIVD